MMNMEACEAQTWAHCLRLFFIRMKIFPLPLVSSIVHNKNMGILKRSCLIIPVSVTGLYIYIHISRTMLERCRQVDSLTHTSYGGWRVDEEFASTVTCVQPGLHRHHSVWSSDETLYISCAYIVYHHVRSADDVSFTGCSIVYSFVTISNGMGESDYLYDNEPRVHQRGFWVGKFILCTLIQLPFVGVRKRKSNLWNCHKFFCQTYPRFQHDFENIPSKGRVISSYTHLHILFSCFSSACILCLVYASCALLFALLLFFEKWEHFKHQRLPHVEDL